MRILISEKQLKHIISKTVLNQEISEEGEEGTGEPEAGTSSDGDKKTGATKWESGVTRGPANQIGVTKWSDIVGSTLKRGKANPLSEQGGATKGKPTLPKISIPKTTETEIPPFTDTYKTFWGEAIEIPRDKYGNEIYKVELWDASTNRVNSFNMDSEGKYYITKKINGEDKRFTYNAPYEGYLRKIFPDGTIKSITDTRTGKRYHTTMSINDLSEIVKKRGETETQWPAMMKAIDLDIPTTYQWLPRYGYFWYSDPVHLQGQESFPIIKKAKVSGDYDYFSKTPYTRQNEVDRYMSRKSYNGLDVPKGMDPNKYDEYVWRRNKITDNISGFDSNGDKYFGSTTPEQERMLADLDKEYKSPEGEGGVPLYSYGTDERTSKKYEELKKKYEDFYNPKIAELEKRLMFTSSEIGGTASFGGDGYVNDAKPNPEYQQLVNQLDKLKIERDEKLKKLKSIFGYDYQHPSILGKGFDEFWDTWGTPFQIVVNIALIAGSGGIAGIFTGGAAITARLLAVPIADAMFNGLVAAYQKNRGQDTEAFISLVCALVPLGKYGFGIARVNKEACFELAAKIRNAGPGLFVNMDRLGEFVALLGDEERYILRNVASLDRKVIQDGLDLYFHDFKTYAGKMGYPVVAASARTWRKYVIKEFGFEGGLPTAAGILNGIFGFVEDKNKQWNYPPEQLMSIKKAIKDGMDGLNSTEDLEKLLFANDIANMLEDQQQKGSVKELANGVSGIFANKTFKNMTEEDIKRIDVNLKLVDDIKKKQ
jgi:hypothetical protein